MCSTRPFVACVACVVALVVANCKPAEEPSRRELAGAGAGADHSWPAPRDVGVPPSSGTILIDAPSVEVPPVVVDLAPTDVSDDATAEDTGPTADTAAAPADTGPDAADAGAIADSADATLAPDTAAPPADPTMGPSAVVLSDELIARVRARPSDAAQDEARRLNRVGLQKHRRLELDSAIRDYREALVAWAGHPFANYNLACAYALTGRLDDALQHLAVLAAVGDTPSRDRLLSARTDADFDALLDDPRFRELTGYVPIIVTWSPGRDQRVDAERIATELRAAHLGARAAPTAWVTAYPRPTLLVRPRDPLASRAATEMGRALTLRPLERADLPHGVGGAERGATPSVVLVLPDPTADRPIAGDVGAEGAPAPPSADDLTAPVAPPVDPGPVAVRIGDRTLSDLLGVRLSAREDGTVGRLLLKPTGFFEWEIVAPNGARTLRRGRYAVRGGALALDYREDVETPGADPSAPEVRFEEGRKTTHAFSLTAEGLALDGVVYRSR